MRLKYESVPDAPLPTTYLHGDRPSKTNRRTWIIISILMFVSVVVVITAFSISGSNSKAKLDETARDSQVSKDSDVYFPVVTHHLIPKTTWGDLKPPYPTGAYWLNIALGLVPLNQIANQIMTFPIGVLPYAVKCDRNGVQLSYGAFRRRVSQNFIADVWKEDLTVTSTSAYVHRFVKAYDPLTVTVEFQTQDGNFRTFLVKGSPYITLEYDNLTPKILSFDDFVNVYSEVPKDAATGTHAVVTIANGQRWYVYCSVAVIWRWEGTNLITDKPITGAVRVAHIPSQPYSHEISHSKLRTYADAYPVAATMEYRIDDSEDQLVAVLKYNYFKKGTGELLMLALPHHVDMFDELEQYEKLHPRKLEEENGEGFTPSPTFELFKDVGPYYGLKGAMTAVVGQTWEMLQPLTTVSWEYEGVERITASERETIIALVKKEVLNLPPNAVDPYNMGKQIGRMARLAIMADTFDLIEERDYAVGLLKEGLLLWYTGQNEDYFLYDKTWGGIVTFHGIDDPMADFGSGYYNDHHFHYGYFCYAAAVVVKFHPEFYWEQKGAIDALQKDIGSYDPNDPHFPLARHKDFFDGHSWASGLFWQGDGKSQESSSESLNAYYGLLLLGEATNNTELTNWGKLLYSLELRSTKKYWHMPTDSIYDSVFAANKMVGVVGALDTQCSTWFGNKYEYVHGINIMPITPATAELLDYDYVTEEYPVVSSRLSLSNLEQASESDVTEEWRSIIYADHAVVDKNAAVAELSSITDFGIGNTKANTLLWAATRPDVGPFVYNATPPNYEQLIKPECNLNTGCDALGIVGMCCPTTTGVFLGCCPIVDKPKMDERA